MRMHLIVEGNVAADPELRFTPAGVAVCNLRVMHTARYLDRESGEWTDGDTTTYDVACWRKLAENVAEGVQKGDTVTVTTTNLRVTQNGEYTNLRTNAENVSISARWCAPTSNRTPKAPVEPDGWTTQPAADLQPAF